MMTRCGGMMLGALLVFAGSATAQNFAEEFGTRGGDSGYLPSSAQLSENPAAELLLRRVESIDWNERTFEDVLRWLREEGDGRVNVVARWNYLSAYGIMLESLVTLQLNNTTMADVLNETIAYLSPDSDEVGYRAIGNKLVISTRQDFGRKMYTRVYDVTDILFRVPNFGQAAPQIDLTQNAQGGGGQGGGGGQTAFGGAGGGQGQDEDEGGQQAEQEMEERLTMLRELIEQTVAPETWDAGNTRGAGPVAAGQLGRIRTYNRSLIVTNTIEVHEEISGLFAFGD